MVAAASLVAGAVVGCGSDEQRKFEIRPGDDLAGRLGKLEAGDEVLIHSGNYRTPGFLEVTWAGSDGSPIVIRGAPGEARPVIAGVPSQNVLNVNGSHFRLSHVELRGGGHGLRLKDVDHATLDDLVVHDVGDVGISCNFPGAECDEVTIRASEIYDTGKAGDPGEGIYVGCQPRDCVFRDGLVERNFVHDTRGEDGDGIEIKPGSYGNTVRDNVIYRTKGPGTITWGYDDGPGRRPNVVERNLVWRAGDDGIQVTGQAVVRNNVVLGARSGGIASRPREGSTAKDLMIEHNTVVAAGGACLHGDHWGTPGPLVANNALYCAGAKAVELPEGVGRAALAANVILGSSDARRGILAGARIAGDLGDPGAGDVYPPRGSKLIDAGEAAHAARDDFNGTVRTGPPDVGAYERTAGANPGWRVREGLKDPVR